MKYGESTGTIRSGAMQGGYNEDAEVGLKIVRYVIYNSIHSERREWVLAEKCGNE